MSALINDKESRWHTPIDNSLIEYGALHKNLDDNDSSTTRKTFYLTTAIAYTNGYPHMGHAYEFMSADIIIRFHRLLGYDTYFLTGSDEHGQKVASSAEKAGRAPLDHCNIFVNGFKALNQRLLVTNDQYIRTTDASHKDTAQKLWVMCADKGDIYLGSYEGWYNEREEVFVTDTEAEAMNFVDPGSNVPLKRVVEESYFFKLGNYADRLIAHIESNPEFIQPEQYRNNIVGRLKKEGLRDLSLSRTSFSWGIPMPDGFDKRHVMYVWFDALSNYLSGVHGLDSDHPLAKYWPANMHIIGKDIIW
jgi:methionyl-tRNA synthetase